MPKKKDTILRHILDIIPVPTSHGTGEKRVIATQNETGKPITQIARTRLKAGNVVEVHDHPTMDEHFFFLKGQCGINVSGQEYLCAADDYIFIPAGNKHSISVLRDTDLITIGIAIE